MRRLAIAIATVFAAAAPAAFADHDTYRSYDNRDYSYGAYNNGDTRDYRGERARVIETRPVTEAVGQREECWNPRAGHFEEVRPDNHDNNRRNLAGTVIGGLAGGIIGHQVGSGTGNTAATIGGAALGAYAGNRVERNRNDDSQPDLDRSNCRVIGASGNADNVQAYDVRYRWNGREYVARMDHDPGQYVEIGRDVNADGTPFNTLAEGNYQPYPR